MPQSVRCAKISPDLKTRRNLSESSTTMEEILDANPLEELLITLTILRICKNILFLIIWTWDNGIRMILLIRESVEKYKK